MSTLKFIEKTHQYFIDGVEKAAVGKILESVGVSDFSFIPTADRERYFTRGKYVHLAMELLLRGGLNWDTVDERILGYVKAGEKFLLDTGFKAICIEKPLYHPIWDYCGTSDTVGIMAGREVVVDWKSGQVTAGVKWQTAAYAELYNVNGIASPVERYGVELKENGKYRMSECWMDTKDWVDFSCFLTTYKKQKVRISDGKCEWPGKG